MAHHHAEPVGGPLLTKPYKFLLAFLGFWGLILVWRFAAGIGEVSGLTDGYPWGIWIAFDVVTGTALACGGYAIAILCYIMNKGKYHPLVRPALLTSALGYSMAGRSSQANVRLCAMGKGIISQRSVDMNANRMVQPHHSVGLTVRTADLHLRHLFAV